MTPDTCFWYTPRRGPTRGGYTPASYRIDTRLGIVFSVATGTVTDEDLLGHQRTLAGDPEFHPGMRQLADFRGTTEIKATPEGVRSLISKNPWGKGAKRAVIAPNETIYGLARMFELGRIDPQDEVRVFRTIEEARAWLGLPPEEPSSP